MSSDARTGTTDLHRDLALTSCVACGAVAEVTGSFRLPGLDGEESYARTRCIAGHMVVIPAFALPGE